MQREVSGLTDRHLRLAAEFDNYRKRTERERAELYARAQGDLVKRLLEPIDDLERVAHHAESPSAKSLLEGVQLVEKKLLQNLRAAGLEPIEPAGQPFDPSSMEAVGVVPADSPEQDGLVADVFQKGYRFGGSLIRPARVRVRQHED
jgi:molecular chaperone GrpE